MLYNLCWDILLFTVLLVILEAVFFNRCLHLYKIEENSLKNKISNKLEYSLFLSSFDEYYKEFDFRPVSYPENPDKTKNPIILFGCSYVWGNGLDEKNTLSEKLAEYTKRIVYNRGIKGGSFQHMLYQSEDNTRYYNEVNTKNPDYIIFVFEYDLLRRLYKYIFEPWYPYLYLRYKYNKSSGKLIRIFFPPPLNI